MSRRQQWPPPIKLHPGRNADRVWWKGRWHYLGPHGSEEAIRAYGELLAGAAAPPAPEEKTPAANPAATVNDVLAAWWRGGCDELTARGREPAQFRLSLQPLVRLHGGLPAALFGPVQFREVRKAMLDGSWIGPGDRTHPRRSGGYTRTVTNMRMGRIRRVWRWAEESGLIPRGSYASLLVVKSLRRGAAHCREGVERQSPGLDAFRRVVRHAPPVVRAMLCVQWWTGMRPGELRTMRAGDVDASGAAWLYRPRQHKTDWLGHSRVVALGPKARAALAPWLARASAAGPDGWVWPPHFASKRSLGHYTCAGYCQAVRRAADLAGVAGFHSYLCRHEARERVGRKYGDEAARAVLGHRTLSTTLGYGRRIDTDRAAEVQGKIG